MTHDVLAFGDTIHLVDFGADGPLVSFASVNATWNSVVDADQFNGLVYITNLDLSTGDFRLCQVQPLFPFTLCLFVSLSLSLFLSPETFST